jgi:pyoverdine/dityrosine biosynthesis protein Dit1
VRAIDSLTVRNEPLTHDLLHTPTPWHNCIIEIEGDHTLYLAKSRVAHDALAGDAYQGAWAAGDHSAWGGHFLLREKPCPTDKGET